MHDFFVVSKIAVAHHRADFQAAAFWFNAVERESIDVDEQFGTLDVELHQVDQCRATSDKFSAAWRDRWLPPVLHHSLSYIETRAR